MFSFVFGIPLSFATLITGVALGLTSSWGVRYPWTIGDVVALTTATALAVYKPGRRLRRDGIRKDDDSSSAEPSTKRTH
jgi:hypothetical protein